MSDNKEGKTKPSLFDRFKNIKYNKYYPLIFTGIFIFIIVQYSFTTLDTIFYDLWIQSDILHKTSDEIVIVTIDQESDQFLGESYPYTYASHYRALDRIIKSQPKQVGYIADFPAVSDKLELSNKNDLENLLRTRKNILKGVSLDNLALDESTQSYQSFPYSLGKSFGRKFSRDQVVRRIVVNESGEDSLFVHLGSVLNNKKGISKISTPDIKGNYYDRLSDSSYSLFKYARGKYDEIPFHRVVVGYYPDDFFKGKTVIVGPKYLSRVDDFKLTPFDRTGATRMSTLQIYAQMVQAISEKRTVGILPNMFSKILAILLSLVLALAISRLQPAKGLLVIVYIVVAMFISSFALFHFVGYWIDISYIILSVFAVYYIWVPFRAIAEYQSRYAIEKEAKMLKKVDHLKQNFISLMSHDLKTPVAKIAGIADILKTQYKNSEHQNELLQNVVNSTKELNKFISSILDLTKIESKNFNIKKSSKDINPIIENIVFRLEFEAKSYGVKLDHELSPLYPIHVDPTLIDRVISNLVENALKYSGEGSQVTVKSWDDPDWVYIEVRDNGRGISPESLQNIFEKFYRVKNDSVHAIKGSGLGLYLVKYFIELHQGSIEASSQVGNGTVFLIKLKNA